LEVEALFHADKALLLVDLPFCLVLADPEVPVQRMISE